MAPAPSDPLSRIDVALARIEAVAARPPAARADAERLERLRAKTQAALAELDAVIARTKAR